MNIIDGEGRENDIVWSLGCNHVTFDWRPPTPPTGYRYYTLLRPHLPVLRRRGMATCRDTPSWTWTLIRSETLHVYQALWRQDTPGIMYFFVINVSGNIYFKRVLILKYATHKIACNRLGFDSRKSISFRVVEMDLLSSTGSWRVRTAIWFQIISTFFS